MKDLMSAICLDFMHRGEGALCYLAQTRLCLWGVTVAGGRVIQNSSISLWGIRNKISEIRKIAPSHP